ELTLARVYLRTGAADKAVTVLNRLIETEPEQAEAVALLAEALEDAGRPADAVSLLEEAVRTQPAFMSPLAELYERQERWEDAAAAYEKAVVRNPRSAELKMRLAIALLSSGRAGGGGRALELLEPIREARPADPRVLYLVAQAQRTAGKLEAAEQTARVLITVAPSLVSGPYALAQILSDREQYAEAIKVLEEACTHFPQDVSLRFEMGAIYERQKRYAEAERQFRDVIARDPVHGPALNYLGYMLADRGEHLEEAIGFINRALQVEPDNGSYLDSLGWAYFKANRLDLAETTLRKAAAQRLTSSAVQDHLGELLFRLGRYDEAASAWERALAGDGAEVDGAAIQRKLQAARARGKGRR
ncbi:MAG: tetratricopeptide repeat protein, partial [Acidobacteria bacterium]